jgi:serine O-acetyltransferase
VVGVPGHVILRHGKRVVITDPKQITDPLSDALHAVASQVKDLKAKVEKLEGREPANGNAPDALQDIIGHDYQI